ncbi:MAG: DNA methyltransferase [Patescibacteria group bacterium]
MHTNISNDLKVVQVSVKDLKPAPYNPRKHSKEVAEQLKESIKRFGMVDPLVCNSASERKNVVIGGHFRLKIAKELGYKEVPVVYVSISSLKREQELNLRLNKNIGEFDLDLLAAFDESVLGDIGFSSEELDDIFITDVEPEQFDLKKELEKLNIKEITIKKGDILELDGSRVMCGDSTVKKDVLKLMGGTKADLCLTDPPYILDYLRGKKKNGKATEGFGYKRDRRYLETDVLPDNFTELWMANVAEVAKENFHIIVFENWKNIRTIWDEMEKRWKVKNMIVWHLPNRTQGFATKYKFFSKHDIAMVGSSYKDPELNLEDEEELLQNDYETALYAVGGKPHWEGYLAGKKVCPTDFIEFNAADEKSSGQGVIFGVKPIEVLTPYVKVLSQRDDLIIDFFGGSGSLLITALRMKRRAYLMEKSVVYTEIIRRRWEQETGKRAKLISGK